MGVGRGEAGGGGVAVGGGGGAEEGVGGEFAFGPGLGGGEVVGVGVGGHFCGEVGCCEVEGALGVLLVGEERVDAAGEEEGCDVVLEEAGRGEHVGVFARDVVAPGCLGSEAWTDMWTLELGSGWLRRS